MDVIRIHKGRKGDYQAVETLTDDPADRFCFVARADSLPSLFSLAEVARLIGFSEKYLTEKLEMGFVFTALRFRVAPQECFRADWSGLLELLHRHYAKLDVTSELLNEMRALNFSRYWDGWNDARRQGKMDERYKNLDRVQVPIIDPVSLREFLFFEFGMRDLFRGDGFAWDESGNRGAEEYLVRNMRRVDIDSLTLVDL